MSKSPVGYLILSFFFVAKRCPPPPEVPDVPGVGPGEVALASTGYAYADACPLDSAATAVAAPGDASGCGAPTVRFGGSVDLGGGDGKREYEVTFPDAPAGDKVRALLVFTQPVSPATVTFNGPVSIRHCSFFLSLS